MQLWLLSSPKVISAQIIINEVMPAPESGSEWIELYNSGELTIELNNWQLEDKRSAGSCTLMEKDDARIFGKRFQVPHTN